MSCKLTTVTEQAKVCYYRHLMGKHIILKCNTQNNDYVSQYKKKYTPSSQSPRVCRVQKSKRSGTKYFSNAIATRIRIGLILEVLGEMSLTD